MLTDALEALAAAGGTALVGAMATDAWQAVREKVAHIFSRQGTQRRAAVEAQLDSNVGLVEGASDPGRAARGWCRCGRWSSPGCSKSTRMPNPGWRS
jgi:hypothetical protein